MYYLSKLILMIITILTECYINSYQLVLTIIEVPYNHPTLFFTYLIVKTTVNIWVYISQSWNCKRHVFKFEKNIFKMRISSNKRYFVNIRRVFVMFRMIVIGLTFIGPNSVDKLNNGHNLLYWNCLWQYPHGFCVNNEQI